MHFNWHDVLIVLLQAVLAYYSSKTQEAMAEAHRCIDRAKRESEARHDSVIQFLGIISKQIKP